MSVRVRQTNATGSILTTADPTEKRFGRSLVAAIVFGFAALIVLGIAGGWALRQTQLQGERVIHTYQVENALHRLRTTTERVGTSRRGFLLSGEEFFVTSLEEAAAENETLLAELEAMTADNPGQQENVARLRQLDALHIANARAAIAAMRADPEQDVRALFASDNGVELINEIRTLARAMTDREGELLAFRAERQDRGLTLAYVVLSIAGLLLLVVAGGTIWLVLRNLEELRRSRNTLRGMNEILEGAVQVRTADLQRANSEIQRFAYIVSHDLRSPLVNVMGFTSELDAATGELSAMIDRAEAEAPHLVTPEARLAVKEDLPEAIGFIRSSTQKMDRLINAILRLSREGRRVITPEPLDMDAMLSTITDTLQHRLGETGTTVTIEGPLPTIVSDRGAVEQVFSNLVENAVKYLKPGRPGEIFVRGKKSGRRIVFEVEDNGRGIDPKAHDRVFDLFRRSGTQDQPGEGIGLAHVRAMAYRLGGTISCESALDEGATFRLSIPENFEGNKEG